MAGRGKAMATVAKLGVKYGPAAYEAIKHGREPAQAAAIKAYSRLSARRQALAHAAVLVDGSVAKAFAADQPVWVVFSGDEPVASHPSVDSPLTDLLRHADPAKRICPDEVGRAGRRKRASSRTSAPDPEPLDEPTSDESPARADDALTPEG